ncbi:MAG: GMC family oxidoreductase [Cyclobacteriaceae bacterium]
MNLNLKAKKQNTYDAIVVGTGISGGWAAKELCEKGLKTLVLERGRDVKHGDYPTATKQTWELPYGDEVPQEEINKHYPVQSRTGYTIKQSSKHWFVKDSEHPYTEVKRMDWMRGYHVGGRSIMWGRHSYRWSEMDFEANAKDGIGVDWPIRYKDIEPWYDYVEQFVGIQGQNEGLAQLPDGKFLPPMELNCVEKHVKQKVAENFGGRMITVGRTANLSQSHLGRGPCQYRNKCIRGCPYAGYFSSNSATLPAAAETGNMTLRPNSIVTEVMYDADSKKATGVRILDAETREVMEFNSRIVFLCASAFPSTQILMQSTSDRFPTGMGNDSDQLGRNIMDHHLAAGAGGETDMFADKYYSGRRPTGVYIPRFRNLKEKRTDYIRGFGYQGGADREGWQRNIAETAIGRDLKENLGTPGKWKFGVMGFGETLPDPTNRFTLNNDLRDMYGQPTLTFDAELKENELAMRKDMAEAAAEMLEAAGLKNVNTYDRGSYPGIGIHEMGTARMGRDPKTSVLNKNNQVHGVKNVFVTDGAAMTSAACQNPSLTYMALTARAADFAVREINRGNL